MAKRVSCGASAAVGGFGTGAGPRIRAVGLDLVVARQAAFFPWAGVVSISSNSPSSISCTLRRSVSPRTARRRSISCRLALRRLSAMVARRSIRSMSSSCSASASAMKSVHAHAGVGEKLIDQLHGVRFAPHVLLHEFFCLAGPRIVQDFVHVQVHADEIFLTLSISVRFILGTLVRQRLRIIRLVFRKIVLKNFRKIVRKVFRVQIVMFSSCSAKKSSSASSPRARIKLDFRRRHRKTSHSKDTTSAMNISSIISTGFTAAQIRARSWS